MAVEVASSIYVNQINATKLKSSKTPFQFQFELSLAQLSLSLYFLHYGNFILHTLNFPFGENYRFLISTQWIILFSFLQKGMLNIHPMDGDQLRDGDPSMEICVNLGYISHHYHGQLLLHCSKTNRNRRAGGQAHICVWRLYVYLTFSFLHFRGCLHL